MRRSGNIRTGTVLAAFLMLLSSTASAAEHLVPLTTLRQDASAAGQARQDNLQSLNRFLAAEPVAKILRAAGMDPAKVRQGASLLSDAELVSLAAKAETSQREFAAGSLSNQDLTYVVIALGAVCLVLIVVAAR